MIDEAKIAEVGRRLAEAAPSARVFVFGSHARGDAGPRSDLDILVIEPEVENPAEEAIRLRRTLDGLAVPVDIVVISESYAEEWRDVRGSIVHAALADSRPLTV